MTITIDTRDISPAERLAHMRTMAGSLPEPVDVHSDQPEAFASVSRFTEVGAVVVGSLVTTGTVDWEIRRTPKLIRRSDPEAYVLMVCLHGTTGVEQFRHNTALNPGQMALYDTSYPVHGLRRTTRRHSQLAMIAVPKRLIPVKSRPRNEQLGIALPATTGIGQLLRVVAARLIVDAPGYRTADAIPVAATVTGLLTALLTSSRTLEEPGTAREFLLARVQAFISEHLAEPRLTADAIAAAHHISRRTLQRLFTESGTTLSDWIRAQRLNRCQQELADPAQAHRPVQSIATQWGFADASHLTRAFRGAYGVTPGEYRRSILA